MSEPALIGFPGKGGSGAHDLPSFLFSFLFAKSPEMLYNNNNMPHGGGIVMDYEAELAREREYTARVQQILCAVIENTRGHAEFKSDTIRMILADAWDELRMKPTALSPRELEQLPAGIGNAVEHGFGNVWRAEVIPAADDESRFFNGAELFRDIVIF